MPVEGGEEAGKHRITWAMAAVISINCGPWAEQGGLHVARRCWGIHFRLFIFGRFGQWRRVQEKSLELRDNEATDPNCEQFQCLVTTCSRVDKQQHSVLGVC